MIFSTAAVLAALVSFVSAADHQIVVGGSAGLVYTPNSITAAVGDTVTFIYESKNHTVTQSAFATPCELLTNATTGAVGFDSGFVPVAAAATDLPAWTLQIEVATPIWFYCAQANHCQQGMVGAINAPTNGTKTFDAFRALAMGTNGTSGSAPAPNPSGVGASGAATTTDIPAAAITTAASGTTTSEGSAATTTSATPNSGASRLTSTGVALGAIAAVALVFA